VLPVEKAEGAHFLTGVEEGLLAVELNDGDVVVELACAEVIGIEGGTGSIDDLHGPDVELGGTGEGDIEESEVIAGAAFLLPDILSVFDGFEFVGFAFRLSLFTAVVAVIVDGVIGDVFAVEVDGGGSGGLGVVGHLEFVGSGGLELREREGWEGEGKEQ